MANLMKVEDELRLHDRAMASTSCGITIADATLPDMPLIYVNDAFQAISGYAFAEIVGRNCRFLQAGDRQQPALEPLRAALREGTSCTVTLRNYRKDGALFWNELFMSPVYDGARLTHFVGIQTDVTARKRAEEALVHKQAELEKTLSTLRDTQTLLIHSEKMNALGQMVAGIAHEINNPVSFVNSNLHSLRGTLGDIVHTYERLELLILEQAAHLQPAAAAIRQQADLNFIIEDVDDLLRSSLDGLTRIKRIVDSLRTFSRLDEAELKTADLEENIRSTLLITQGEMERRIEVVVEMDNLPDIMCYPAELNQVFLNIIVNAVQAMPGTGKLTIRGWEEGSRVVLQFTDTGVGMTPDVREKVFDPFFTTKPVGEGTGLGLAIAHKIITSRHHGTIEVDSSPGAGSTFTIRLPKDVRE